MTNGKNSLSTLSHLLTLLAVAFAPIKYNGYENAKPEQQERVKEKPHCSYTQQRS